MLEIVREAPNSLRLKGRMDAVQSEAADKAFDQLDGVNTIYCDQLDYISSAGLTVLLHTQQRLLKTGGSLKLRGLNPLIKQVFVYAGFDTIFDIG